VNVNRWLSVRLEFVGAVIILVSSALALVALITSVRNSFICPWNCTLTVFSYYRELTLASLA
jgi:hypothetical protein